MYVPVILCHLPLVLRVFGDGVALVLALKVGSEDGAKKEGEGIVAALIAAVAC